MTEIKSTEEILNDLYKARDGYMQLLNQIEVAISSLEGTQKKPNEQFDGQSRPHLRVSHLRPQRKHRLKSIINKPYDDSWKNPDKIMWLLIKYGQMTPAEMIEKISEFVPNLSEQEKKDRQEAIGYRAGQLAKEGQLESERQGYFKTYWVSDPELLAMNKES